MSKSSILIVEDEALIAANIVQSLSSLGYTVFEPVATGDEAIQAVLAEKPDLVLMDIELYGPINGIETAKKIRAIANIPVVYLTAYTDEMLLKEARLTEPYGYIVKPSHNRELHATIEMALYKHALDSKLRESEEKYRTLLETLNEGVWVIDNEAVTTFVNPKMAEILGYTVDEMTGRSLFSFMDDEGRRICEWNIERRQQGIKEQHDFEFLKKDETRIYASLEATPLLGKDGQYLGAIAGVVDITERRLSENMLRDLSTYNRGLIEASLDPLVTISREGKIQDVNSSTETITGFDRNELIGTDFHEYFTEPERAREGYQRVFSEGKVINYPLEIRHHDGHTAPVLYNATVYYDNEGEIKGVF
ncbi:MAG: PAS domain S-box protein, partial [Methanomicrobiales archaeon]